MQQNDRVISLIDILGFPELVVRPNFGELFETYLDTIKEVVSIVSPSVEHIVVSDAIVLIAPDNTEKDLLDLLRITAGISFQFLVNHQLPVRGCIACGRATYKSSGSDTVLAGDALVEAFKYGQQMDWVGSMISPYTAKKFPMLDTKIVVDGENRGVSGSRAKAIVNEMAWNLSLQRYEKIPFKSGKGEITDFEGYCVVPHQISSNDASHIQDDLTEYKAVMHEQLIYAPDTTAQKKCLRTQEFIDAILVRWTNIRQSQVYRDLAWNTHDEMVGTTMTQTQSPPPRFDEMDDIL